MKEKLFVILFALIFIFYSCGKKENPNAKFIGTYTITDSWGSSNSLIGNGTLEYKLTITADGEDGIIINNVNKTLDGIKAKVSNDSFMISKQTIKCKSGKTYDVDAKTGTLTENILKIDFGYDDISYGDAIGYIYCIMNGKKESVSK